MQKLLQLLFVAALLPLANGQTQAKGEGIKAGAMELFFDDLRDYPESEVDRIRNLSLRIIWLSHPVKDKWWEIRDYNPPDRGPGAERWFLISNLGNGKVNLVLVFTKDQYRLKLECISGQGCLNPKSPRARAFQAAFSAVPPENRFPPRRRKR